MKKAITSLFGILFLSLSMLNAQDVNSMNKKELRNYITTLSAKIHSLKAGNFELLNSKNEISANSKTLENEINVNNAEIEQLNVFLEQSKTDLRILNTQNSTLNSQNSTLKDSIKYINNLVFKDSTTSNSNDFLNKYYFDQIPLPNNSYQLVLSKVILGNQVLLEDDNYNYTRATSVLSLPETIDRNAIRYWSVKPNVTYINNTEAKAYLKLRNIDYFNSKFPKIEVLKNKLFTIIYNDGSEESFLFNVKECEHNNNQREVIQIDLANEQVENNTSKDIVWRIFAIENECYIALTYSQIERFKLDLWSINDGIEWSNEYKEEGAEIMKRKKVYLDRYGGNERYSFTTTGNGIYLSRKKDSYMDEGQYINPENIIFLLKLE